MCRTRTPVHRAPSLLFLSLLLLEACGEQAPPGERDAARDASWPDVRVVDASVPQDAPSGDATPSADARPDGADDASTGGVLCPSDPLCDPVTGLGCGTDGWCVLQGDVPRCVSSAGDGAEGAPCDSVRACRVGLACFQVGGRAVCLRPCCEESTCGFGARCVAGARLANGMEPPWGRCTTARRCDVLAQSGCSDGEGCYIVDASGTTSCRPAGRGGAGDPCRQQEDCRPGFYCGGALGEGRCVRICALDGSDGGCPSEEGSCVRAGASPEGTGLCVFTGGRRSGGR